MREIVIAATLAILTIATVASAQTPGWGYGPGYGPGGGRGGMFCNKGARDPAVHISRRLERLVSFPEISYRLQSRSPADAPIRRVGRTEISPPLRGLATP